MSLRGASLAPAPHAEGPIVRPHLAVRAPPTPIRAASALTVALALSGPALAAEPLMERAREPEPTARTPAPAVYDAAPAAPAPGGQGAAPEPSGASSSAEAERFSLHYQATVATQRHPYFHAPYSGTNSMKPNAENATSVVADLFAGARLWRGGEAFFQPELGGGRGLSSTLGVAAFPSGEVYRVGNPTPEIIVGRMFLRQTVGLGGGTTRVEAGANQLAGTRDRDALVVTVGKVATTDFVDRIPMANDPHTGFMSWGLWSSAAYDYPADTRGYTWGAAADLSIDWWSVRAGAFLEPKVANAMELEWDIGKARGLVGEVEGRWTVKGLAGAARALGFVNTAHMGSYDAALALSPTSPDVTATRATGRTKAGFAASANQDLGSGLGAFLRVSYNDGRNETWAFTEIDRSVAGGLVQAGSRWGRPDDEVGLAVVVSGLSGAHRRYLAAGGYGFIIGDGALSYAPEILGEVYYRAALTREISIGANYQPIFNPAYNSDRGPIHVLTGRVHVAF